MFRQKSCWIVFMMLIVQTGWRTYRRPDDKSGGHGVGWSPIIPYSFKVPDGWDEVTETWSCWQNFGSQNTVHSFWCKTILALPWAPTQVPVSIADLGGTEIDLRFANPKEGRCFVIVAPVRRFAGGELKPEPQEMWGLQFHRADMVTIWLHSNNIWCSLPIVSPRWSGWCDHREDRQPREGD